MGIIKLITEIKSVKEFAGIDDKSLEKLIRELNDILPNSTPFEIEEVMDKHLKESVVYQTWVGTTFPTSSEQVMTVLD
jgi:hypothetical protein